MFYTIYSMCVLTLTLCIVVKPTSVNLTNKLKVFSSSTQYNLTCIVAGSVPDTEIRWTQNNRPFKRGMVSLRFRGVRGPVVRGVEGNQSGMSLALARRVKSLSYLWLFHWHFDNLHLSHNHLDGEEREEHPLCAIGEHFSNRFHSILFLPSPNSCQLVRAMDASYPLCHFTHNPKTMAPCSNARAPIPDYRTRPSRTRSCWMSFVSGLSSGIQPYTEKHIQV